MSKAILTFFLITISFACNTQTVNSNAVADINDPLSSVYEINLFDTTFKTIHVLVALCDNKYQGIVPVPEKIGNGQDPGNNLYWGCGGGIKTYFKNSKNWKLVRQIKIDDTRLERVIFRHETDKYYLIADAYDGKLIKQCTIDFLRSCSGQMKDTISAERRILGINGNAKLLAYIGHNGLMDFSLREKFQNTDNKTRDAIMLACISKNYFSNYMSETKTRPILWTTGLMAPEAYTLHDALNSYIKSEPVDSIRINAARAYSKYQKCSLRASKNLLVSGF